MEWCIECFCIIKIRYNFIKDLSYYDIGVCVIGFGINGFSFIILRNKYDFKKYMVWSDSV